MSPVQANTRMSDRRGTRAMSLRIRLPPSEGRVEGSRDAEDLVDPPGAAIDGDDEQVTGDPARAGLGRDRREREAPRRVAVREAGELDRLPLAVEKEDPRPLAVGDEEMARRADRHRGDQGSPEHDGRCAPGNDLHDLANAPLPRRHCRPVAPDPQVTAFARRHEPRPGDADVAWVEDTARGASTAAPSGWTRSGGPPAGGVPPANSSARPPSIRYTTPTFRSRSKVVMKSSRPARIAAT